MPGADLLGAAGFSDEVDRHYERVFGSALLLSVMTAGVTLSPENDNGNDLDDGPVGCGSTLSLLVQRRAAATC